MNSDSSIGQLRAGDVQASRPTQGRSDIDHLFLNYSTSVKAVCLFGAIRGVAILYAAVSTRRLSLRLLGVFAGTITLLIAAIGYLYLTILHDVHAYYNARARH